MNKYQKLKQIIREANPNRNWKLELYSLNEIRLADVLLVVSKEYGNKHGKQMLTTKNKKEVDDLILGLLGYWKWEDDNLNHQSDETKSWLIELFVK